MPHRVSGSGRPAAVARVSSPPQIAERILRDSDEFAAYRDADDDLTLLVASVRTG